MIWVLIMVMGGSHGTIATHEFASQQRCEEAAAKFVEGAYRGVGARAFCVTK